MPYIPHTPDDLQEMLSVVGVRTLDDLFADIPQDMRPKSFKLPKGQGEASVCAYFEDLAAKNRPEMISFLGAGYYAHQIPKAVDALAGRSGSIPPTRPTRRNAPRAPCRPFLNSRRPSAACWTWTAPTPRSMTAAPPCSKRP